MRRKIGGEDFVPVKVCRVNAFICGRHFVKIEIIADGKMRKEPGRLAEATSAEASIRPAPSSHSIWHSNRSHDSVPNCWEAREAIKSVSFQLGTSPRIAL